MNWNDESSSTSSLKHAEDGGAEPSELCEPLDTFTDADIVVFGCAEKRRRRCRKEKIKWFARCSKSKNGCSEELRRLRQNKIAKNRD